MRTFTLTTWTTAIIFGLPACWTAGSSAAEPQAEGYVRMHDAGTKRPVSSRNIVQGASVRGLSGGQPVVHTHTPSPCSDCGPPIHGRRRPRYFSDIVNKYTEGVSDLFDDDDVDDDDDGHHSPDHGWGRPVKQPILRAPVLYQKMQPDYWWGTRGSKLSGAYVHYYPTVYTPTDTTQLGYYYQRAPFWRPDYRRLPPVPWPPHWHKRECIAHLPPARVSHPYAAVPVFPSYEPLPHGDSRPQLQPVPGSKQPQVPPAPPEDLNNSAGRSADGVR